MTRESLETVEKWSRALCKAYGVNPDQIIGNPPNPRWLSFTSFARTAIQARDIVEAGQ